MMLIPYINQGDFKSRSLSLLLIIVKSYLKICITGIVGTLTSDKLKGIKAITGIAVTGDKLVLACGSQGLKLFSIR